MFELKIKRKHSVDIYLENPYIWLFGATYSGGLLMYRKNLDRMNEIPINYRLTG